MSQKISLFEIDIYTTLNDYYNKIKFLLKSQSRSHLMTFNLILSIHYIK